MPSLRPTFKDPNTLRSQAVTQLPVKENLPVAYVQRIVQSTIGNIKLMLKALQEDVAYKGTVLLASPTDKEKMILLEDADKLLLDSLLEGDVLSKLEALELAVSSLQTAVANLDSRVTALESPPPPPTEP